MNAIRVGAALLAAIALFPLATASHAVVDDVLAPARPSGAEATVGGQLYVEVYTGRVEVWRETNGCDGLQKSEKWVDGKYCDPDTKVLSLP